MQLEMKFYWYLSVLPIFFMSFYVCMYVIPLILKLRFQTLLLANLILEERWHCLIFNMMPSIQDSLFGKALRKHLMDRLRNLEKEWINSLLACCSKKSWLVEPVLLLSTEYNVRM